MRGSHSQDHGRCRCTVQGRRLTDDKKKNTERGRHCPTPPLPPNTSYDDVRTSGSHFQFERYSHALAHSLVQVISRGATQRRPHPTRSPYHPCRAAVRCSPARPKRCSTNSSPSSGRASARGRHELRWPQRCCSLRFDVLFCGGEGRAGDVNFPRQRACRRPEDCRRRDTDTHKAWVSVDRATVFLTMSLTEDASEVAESYV